MREHGKYKGDMPDPENGWRPALNWEWEVYGRTSDDAIQRLFPVFLAAQEHPDPMAWMQAWAKEIALT